MTGPRIVWQPLPGSQTRFMTCPIYEALLEGTRGGGKTDTLLMTFAQYCGRGFNEHWRGVLFRLTYPQLEDVVKKSKQWFKQIFPTAKWNESDYVWKWPTGEMLYFRYGEVEDDYWNYHGHEYPWLAFEELTNWRDPGFYESMHSTCRSSHPGMPRMVRATCNPFGKGHGWVKERFQLGIDGTPTGTVIRLEGEKPRVAIHSSIHENKILLANDPEYLKTLEALKDPNRRKAWLEGDWDIHVGSFFEGVWDAKRHVVEPFAIPPSWKVWKSMDWGFAAPYAVLWLAMDPDGCIYVWRELYGAGEKLGEGSREPADKVAAKIREIEKHDERNGYEYRMNLADPAIFSNTGTNNTIGGIFRSAGVKWQEAWNGKGSIANGAQEIMRLLAEDKLKIFKTCKHLIRTLPSIGPDDLDPEKYDTKGEDHCFAPDTLVHTDRGARRIDSLTDELVMNDRGEWVPFTITRRTRQAVDVVRVHFADGSSVVCTPDHRFLVGEDKYAEARDLADTICYAINVTESIQCKSPSSATPFKSSTACAITGAGSTSSARECVCTASCGKLSTACLCRPDSTCTTGMKTEATISPTTWSFWKGARMLPTTARISSRLLKPLQRLWKRPKPGTPVRQGASGTGSITAGSPTSCMPRSIALASNAGGISSATSAASSAVIHASQRGGAHPVWMMSSEAAPYAAAPSLPTSTPARAPVPASAAAPSLLKRVVHIEPAGKSDVWCIDVPGRHNFALANGVMVHNCVDALRYGVMRRRRQPDGEQKSGEEQDDMYKDSNDNHYLNVR